jgi:glycosyltransferase involved in cell wall biosynthesis
MDNTPLISIIIPCYNIAQKLPKCLDSIIGQDFSDFEAICVNDASTDNTPQVIERYCDKDNRIRLVSLERNQGLANGRRVGLSDCYDLLLRGHYGDYMKLPPEDKRYPSHLEDWILEVEE